MARSRRRKATSRFWILSILLLIAVLVVWDKIEDRMLAEKDTAIVQLNEQLSDWEVKLADAKRKFEYARSDDFIERLARTELGYIKPGEILYVRQTDNNGN